jgi:hypothetical protein
MFEDSGVELSALEHTIREETVARIHAGLGEEATEEALALGRSLRRSDVLAHAWED